MKRKYFGGWKQHLCPQIRLFCHWKTTLFFTIFNPSIVVDEVCNCMKKKQITCLSFSLLSYRWGGGPWQGKTDDVSSNHNQYSIQAHHQTHRWKYNQDFFCHSCIWSLLHLDFTNLSLFSCHTHVAKIYTYHSGRIPKSICHISLAENSLEERGTLIISALKTKFGQELFFKWNFN